jgi:3'-5' exonuclease
MLKVIHPKVLCFDVEWIPDPKAAEILHYVDLSEPGSEREAFETLWKEEGKADEKNPQPYLKTILCRIVSIAGIVREDTGGSIALRLFSMPTEPDDPEKCGEARILSGFLRAVGEKRPQVVGYNSSNADLPIITQRAIIHGLRAPGFGERPAKPWEGADYFDSRNSDYNVDLCPMLGRFAQTPSLHQVASLSGIPGKMGVSGASVAELWLEGKTREIVEYNEYDAFTTFLLWARVAHFANLLSDAQYEEEQIRVRELLESEIAAGKQHLQPFVEEWDRLRELTGQD